jgi:hypothetical protein
VNKPPRNKHRTDNAVKNWRQKITEQQVSGQEPGEFCRQRNLCATSFYAWRKRLGMKSPLPAPVPGNPALLPVVKDQRVLPEPLKPTASLGFLRLDSSGAFSAQDSTVEQRPRVLWIETPGGYRVAVNGGVGLVEVFGLLKSL